MAPARALEFESRALEGEDGWNTLGDKRVTVVSVSVSDKYTRPHAREAPTLRAHRVRVRFCVRGGNERRDANCALGEDPGSVARDVISRLKEAHAPPEPGAASAAPSARTPLSPIGSKTRQGGVLLQGNRKRHKPSKGGWVKGKPRSKKPACTTLALAASREPPPPAPAAAAAAAAARALIWHTGGVEGRRRDEQLEVVHALVNKKQKLEISRWKRKAKDAGTIARRYKAENKALRLQLATLKRTQDAALHELSRHLRRAQKESPAWFVEANKILDESHPGFLKMLCKKISSGTLTPTCMTMVLFTNVVRNVGRTNGRYALPLPLRTLPVLHLWVWSCWQCARAARYSAAPLASPPRHEFPSMQMPAFGSIERGMDQQLNCVAHGCRRVSVCGAVQIAAGHARRVGCAVPQQCNCLEAHLFSGWRREWSESFTVVSHALRRCMSVSALEDTLRLNMPWISTWVHRCTARQSRPRPPRACVARAQHTDHSAPSNLASAQSPKRGAATRSADGRLGQDGPALAGVHPTKCLRVPQKRTVFGNIRNRRPTADSGFTV